MKELVISDIHLLHLRTPTDYIIDNLVSYIFTEENKELDVIYIAGDLFDNPGETSSPEYLATIKFLVALLNFCYEYDIMLRVLEGTPFHDWEQPKVLLSLNDKRENKVDLKYFDKLDIEYNPRLKQYILYIPDEWESNHQVIENQIQNKLNELGITQVDTAILHGQFNYQMAGIPHNAFCYREDYFLNLVKGFIHIGHHHTRSTFDRISAQGSFDRLSQGQEEDKGFTIVEDGVIRFVVNKDAYTYKTLRINKNETLNSLDEKICKFPRESHIRLQFNKDHPFNLVFNELRARYSEYNLTKLTKDNTKKKLVTDMVKLENLTPEDFNVFTKGVVNSLKEFILEGEELTQTKLDKLDKLLEYFKDSDIEDS